MNRELLLIAEQMKDAYNGEPWFGRSVKELLNEVTEEKALEKRGKEHSILELLWHMITWKEFTVSCLREDEEKPLKYFEQFDWRELDHSNNNLWKQGLEEFDRLHNELVEIVQQSKDDILSKRVTGRNYDFRKLLYGIVQHDIYHIGQVASIMKREGEK